MLTGDLGAGKTTLAKGIVEGRGATNAEEVSSPTFALIHEYGDPVSVYHIDLYRLDTEEEANRLGLEEIFDKPALILIEWKSELRAGLKISVLSRSSNSPRRQQRAQP